MPAPDDQADTALLVRSIRTAAAIARKFYGGPYKKWDKGGGNPVTEADIAVDTLLHEVLLAARPDYGWLSEERPDDSSRLARTRVFIVDPIDGTSAFLRRQPHFTLVAAVVTEGRPVCAVIYNPITDEMYEATAGMGATKNGVPIHVSARQTLDGAKMLAPGAALQPSHWRTPWPATLVTENRASLAYRMALVAEGNFDAMLSPSPKNDWDIVSGDLILREAGGRATGVDGATLSYNLARPVQHGVVCAGPALHTILLERLSLSDFRVN